MTIAPDLLPLAVAIDSLAPLPDNPRRGDVDAVARSLDRFGQRKPIVARKSDRTVTAGNHTLAAARQLGWSEVAVVWFDDDDATARAFALADNRTAELGGYDDALLTQMLAAVHDADPEMFEATGWTEDDLRDMLATAHTKRHPRAEPDDVPDRVVGKTVPNDLWILGEHRLLCGDSFDDDNRKRLVDTLDVAMVLTDPPFAIYGSSSGISSSVADDKMVRPFFEQLGHAMLDLVPWFAHVYVCCDWRSYATLWDAFKRAGLTPKNCLVWDKGGAGLGNNYANTHEFVAYFAKMPPETTMTSGAATGQRPVHRPNVLHHLRVMGDERQHNAAKPVGMLADIIEAGCDPGAGVLDLFGGSGSTLIAAQKVGRRCAMMEMEPKWCDVICRRFEAFTGIVPVHGETGREHSFVEVAS